MANGTFDIQQTDAQLQAILNKIQPLVTTGSTAPLGFGYGVCETAGATAAKTVSITNTVLTPGGIIAVNFVNAFTASSPTLSVNGSAAKPIKLYGNAMPMGKVHANTILVMYYDGTQFNVIGILSQTAAAPTGFVDLALPSGLLWCEHNVGNIPTNGTYDAARHNMGAPCRMPTVGEFQELNAQCDSEWTDEDGVAGRRFTSRINGNSIFFPASGLRNGTGLYSRGSYGYYWSASLDSQTSGYSLLFTPTGVNPAYHCGRFYGVAVRAVQ